MNRKILHLTENIRAHGFMITIIIYYRRLINRLFNLIVIGRKDCSIDSRAKILGINYMEIGKHFSAGKGLWLEAVTESNTYIPKLIIGNDVSLSDFNHIGAAHYVKIGNHVLFGSKCYVTDHNHGIYKGENQSPVKVPPVERKLTINGFVIIDDNVWLGDNVVILPNVHIGYGAIIGANSIVSRDIPSNSIAVGIPARVIKRYDRKLKKWISIETGV